MPKLEADKALQFRVLIAANLATVVAGEIRTGSTREAAEAARLRRLLGPLTPTLSPGGVEGEQLNRRLADALRNNEFSPEQLDLALEHLLATARETLEVTNPRFELSDPA